MTAGQRPVLLTFDTNLAGVRGPRAFWATLCEEIGQPLALTPTAASETLRRVRLETEREWTRKLKAIDREQGIGWGRTQLRRLATTAANASRDWLNEEIRKAGRSLHLHETGRGRDRGSRGRDRRRDGRSGHST